MFIVDIYNWAFRTVSSKYRRFGLSAVELMQFTGLTDKNGREIYEGDLVRYEGKSWKNESDGFLARIDWDAEHTSFTGRLVDTSGAFDPSSQAAEGRIGLYVWIKEIEVIGNVYENPELLPSNST
jgi:uncharacterized phage protein (TIGR01671 family)